MRIRKSDLVSKVASKTGRLKVDIKEVLESIVEVIKEEVEDGNDIIIRTFGTFISKISPKRIGRNFHTGGQVIIPETRKMVFKATKKRK